MEASTGSTMKATGTNGTISFGCADVDLTSNMHLLPCCIRQDGPCPISHHFKPKSTGIEIDNIQVEEAFFRGRRLHGTSISLPEKYRGYVLKKNYSVSFEDSETVEDNFSQWETCAEFGSFKYWNHDDVPSQDDEIVRSLQWLTVANAMHRPIGAEELACSISKDQGQQ